MIGSLEEEVREMDGLRAELKDTRDSTAALETELDRVRKECADLRQRHSGMREEYDSLSAENVRLRTQLRETEEQLRELSARIDEAKEVEERLEEFERALTQVESMKAGYERRIALLRDMVKTLKAERKVDDGHAEELRPIEMTSGRSRIKDMRPDPRESLDSATFADKRPASPSVVRSVASESPGEPEEDDDDWLRTLPD